MSRFDEICDRLIEAFRDEQSKIGAKITHHLRNAFVNELYYIITSEPSKLKLSNLVKLQGISRAYSFYELPEDPNILEAYNKGFVYGLTRLCEIADSEISTEESVKDNYESLTSEIQKELKQMLLFVNESKIPPNYELLANKLKKSKGRISQIMAMPRVALYFDIKHLGREKRVYLSKEGEMLVGVLKDQQSLIEQNTSIAMAAIFYKAIEQTMDKSENSNRENFFMYNDDVDDDSNSEKKWMIA